MNLCFIVSFLCCLTVVPPATSHADDRILLYGNAIKPPKTWDESGSPKGILIDIIREIEKRTDLEFDIQMRPWARAYKNALEAQGGIYGLSKTRERLSLFDYSIPMYYDEIVLVVLKGNEFQFNSMADLAGKRIGVTRGASYGDEYADALGTIFIPVYNSNPTHSLRMLHEGRIDATVIGPGKAGLLHFLSRDPYLKGLDDKFVILEKRLAKDTNHIGFRKTMKCGKTLQTINQALRSMWQDGSIDRIIEKY